MKLYSVTEVLSVYQMHLRQVSSQVLSRASDRGIEVHRACSNWASGAWVKKLAFDVLPYVESFIRWSNQFVTKFHLIEQRLYDYDLGYHGRLDFYLEMIDGWKGVVDIKTPIAEGPTWNAQCSAYKGLVEKNMNENGIGAMSLRLNANGGMAKAIHYEPADDHFAAFLSALNAYRYFKQ